MPEVSIRFSIQIPGRLEVEGSADFVLPSERAVTIGGDSK